MGLRFGLCEARNFGPFKSATVDFSVPGLTVVDASMSGAEGSDSNGAGKSMLLEMPTWAVYGRCLRSAWGGDDVVRYEDDRQLIRAREGCRVEQHIVGGERDVVVVRHRLHPVQRNRVALYVQDENGPAVFRGKRFSEVSRGTDTETTDALVQMIGMDFLAYCNSVAFGAREEVKSFFAETDAGRKAVLERILGLGIYADAEQVARQKLRDATEGLNRLREDQRHRQYLRDDRKRALEAALEDRKRVYAQGDRDSLARQLEKAALVCKTAEANVASLYGVLGAAREAMGKQQEDYAAAVLVMGQKRQKAEEGYRKALADEHATLARCSDMEARLKRLNGLVGVCPTCEQRIAGGDKASLIRRVSVEQQALLKALTRARELSAEAKKVVDRLPLSPPPPDTTAVSDASQQYADAGTRLTSAKREEERLRHAMETLTQARADADGKVQKCEEAIDTVSTELGELEGKIEQADAWVACYEFWAEGFGNRGLKSLLIEAALPEINQAATMYARRLIPGARLRLSATTALKTRDAVKEALSLEVHLPRFTRTYGGASKGQRTRLLLSLLLALRDVVSRRAASPFDQFFADELFDGLDRTGSECVAELLGEIAARCPVVLITHDDRLKGEGGRTLTVLHDGREASILSGGKTRSAGS